MKDLTKSRRPAANALPPELLRAAQGLPGGGDEQIQLGKLRDMLGDYTVTKPSEQQLGATQTSSKFGAAASPNNVPEEVIMAANNIFEQRNGGTLPADAESLTLMRGLLDEALWSQLAPHGVCDTTYPITISKSP